MSVFWGWPLGLAALAALLLPILLHLDRRRTLRRLPFAAMRWIGSQHPPRRTVRLIEWLLLALRLLLILAIVLWLAQPLLRGLVRTPSTWLAVAPGVSSMQLQSEIAKADRVVWLTRGFPSIEQPTPTAAQPNASLLRELDSLLAPDDRLRVLLPPTLGGLNAEAIALGRDIDWIIDEQASLPTLDRSDADDVDLVPLSLAVRYSDEAVDGLRWIRAASKAWEVDGGQRIGVNIGLADESLPEHLDALVWFGDAPSDAAWDAVDQGATLLIIASEADASATALWPPRDQRLSKGRWLRLALPLQPNHFPVLHSPVFPAELRTLLFDASAAPDRASSFDVQPMRVERSAVPASVAMRPWLAWLIATLFLLERALASSKRLRGRP